MESIRELESLHHREDLLHRIANQIRQSLELPEILAATVAEIRSFLGSDRVMVYRFHADESGEVIAESVDNRRLPSLYGLNFPADDIPPHARELFLTARQRSIVDVSSGLIGLSPLDCPETGAQLATEDIYYRPVDPCHVEYLKAMGVQSSLVVPILHHNLQTQHKVPVLWGLLVSHHAQARHISEREVQVVQFVADQVSIAIAQSALLTQARKQAAHEATINRVSTLLHTLPTIELQQALEETVSALQGVGGRMYMLSGKSRENPAQFYKVFTYGVQPTLSDGECLEQHPLWQDYIIGETFNGTSPKKLNSDRPRVVTDLYQHQQLQDLALAFEPTQIRGILVVPLQYRQQFLGYLSIFRDEIDTETLWAGHFESDRRQMQPRQSFEAWRELKRGQAQEWTREDLELAHSLGQQFSMAIQQHELYYQVQGLNSSLEQKVQEQTVELQQSLERAKVLKQVTDQIRSTLDLKATLQAIVREVRGLLNTDRAIVYQFDCGWWGEVIVEEKSGECNSVLGFRGPEDCFPEEYAQLYNQGRMRAIGSAKLADLTPCHQEFLQSIQVQANLVVPIRIGGKLWGLLVAHECKAPREWKQSELDLLQQLGDQAAMAIQQAELYEQSRISANQAMEKATQLSIAAEQQKALFRVVSKIRESLDVETIFQTTAREIRKLLGCDRVGVFRFESGSNYSVGEIISEDVVPGFPFALATKVNEFCFSSQYASQYQQGRIHVISDIYDAGLSECYLEMLAQFQVRANLVLPLLKGEELWGLLCLHQCTAPRQWNASEIEFVSQIATQLGVALQQAELLTQTRQQTEKLTRALQDLKQTQSQLIQTEKMSSLGQLVAGIAHEINNPVNFIYGNLSHAAQYTRDLLELLNLYQEHYPNPTPEVLDRSEEIDLDFLEEDLPKILGSMEMGVDRIRQLVLSLRNFSRLDQAETKPVDIHEGLDSTLLILQHRLKAKPENFGIELIKEYSNLPKIECYASQLNQVFMNVISNAIDALEESFGSCSSSTASETATDKKPTIWIRTLLLNNSRVAIEIADNGPGMTQGMQSQIFDPFFTTKPMGKGTGLGLSISYQIVVEKHGGVFKCTSQQGKGTKFWIEIPMKQFSQ
ncbi:MAG: GAF domain-containing protein [Kastovskya adunca ATA6-11-RM4]|jgi:GAF domain-containing protein|nr:GAF domain-containing protein [Kastovskya adunca ATA6-11-RM4]